MFPSSFSTICTKKCKQELVGFLLSLSLHHPNSNVYIICDTDTKKYLDELTPQPKLKCIWFIELDKYSDLNRMEMEKQKIWSDFQMAKANVIEKALISEKDTLFLDSDIIILDKIYIDTDKEYKLGVSPQFITQEYIDKTGYYNGGVLWTNQNELPKLWKQYTKSSRYYDQASIEDLVLNYNINNTFIFGENYNLQTWRFLLNDEPFDKICSYLNVKDNKIYYKNKPLKFIHTHFNENRFDKINKFFIQKMIEAKLYKELIIIERLINEKWIIRIPKQPLLGKWFHKNDSYRELVILLKVKNKDVDVIHDSTINNCWIGNYICSYDRPTLEWITNDILENKLFLLGNGDINIEGKQLIQIGYNVKSWIFWPRRPMILEKFLHKTNILTFNERKYESIFIGNFENSVQEKYRKTEHDWSSALSKYICTAGNKHIFSQEEYLDEIMQSKYGLCLRGYGSKCHREVELMAFGTVPIVTPNVSINSFMVPPIENIHYIFVKTPKELVEKIHTIDGNTWSKMSQACHNWYMKNIHSNNCWNTMIENILYH
jgi:hypothetical protein